jgi:hypothetical protein
VLGTAMKKYFYSICKGLTKIPVALIILFPFLLQIPAGAQSPPFNALSFDGVNDFVSIPHGFGTFLKPSTEITIEAWVRPLNIHTNQYYEVYRKEDGDARHLLSFQEFGTVLSFGLQIAGVYSELDVPIVAANYEGKWTHIAATFDGTVKKLYRNGQLIGSANVSGAIGTSGTAPVIIGSSGGGAEFFNGSIDEVKLWGIALTQDQIQNGMVNPVDALAGGLRFYFNFDLGIANAPNPGINTMPNQAFSEVTATLNNFALNGTISNWVESYAMVIPSMLPPTNVTANSFTANWTSSAIGIVDNYLLDVSTSPSFSSFVPGYSSLNVGLVPSFNVTGITPYASTYYYRVRANKNSVLGQGGYSQVAIQTPPPPSITSFSPASGPITTPVTIIGNYFSTIPSSNTVYFGTVKATVSTATTNSLTVTVPSGASYQPITVTRNNLTAYSSKPFVVTFPTVVGINTEDFSSKQNLTTGNGPGSMVSGDLDGDGRVDLAVVNSSSNYISIFKNKSTLSNILFETNPADVNGDGLMELPTGVFPDGLTTGDIDGNGKLDLVFVNAGNNTVSIFRNVSVPGSISFTARVDFSTSSNPRSVDIRDIDLDGKPDLIVANMNGNSVSVLRNNSGGGFLSFFPKLDFATGNSPIHVSVRDMDTDGKSDIITCNYFANTISVLRNVSSIGSIAFSSKVDYLTGNAPIVSSAGDLDGDNKTDIAVANFGSNSVSLLKNTSTPGSISFNVKVDILSGNGPTYVAINDIDGDNKVDLVTANQSANSISVLKNNSSAGILSFNAKIDYPTTSSQIGLSVIDLDANSKPDIMVSSFNTNSVLILKNQIGEPLINSFSPENSLPGNPITINGTNFIDVQSVTIGGVSVTSYNVISSTQISAIVPGIVAGDVTVTTSYGTGSLGGFFNGHTIISFSPENGPIGSEVIIAGTNFNTNLAANIVYFGSVKAIVTNGNATSLSVIVPRGATFQPITVTTNNLTAYASKPFKVTFSNGPIKFTNNSLSPRIDYDSGPNALGVAIGDLDGDGYSDLAVNNWNGSTGNSISLFRNSGNGTTSFGNKQDITPGTGPWNIASGDLDGDGKLDLVVTNESSGSISVFKNNSAVGSISFATKVDFETGETPEGIAIADLNADGKPDIVVSNISNNIISVFKNTSSNGVISFESKKDFPSGSYPQNLAIGDLDNDGKPDILTASGNSNSLSVFKNISTRSNISFETKVEFAVGVKPWGCAIADLDNDGKSEIISSNLTSSTVSILKNRSAVGSFDFEPKKDFLTATSPISLAIIDLNGDGNSDISVVGSSGFLSILNNKSANNIINFAPKVDFAMASNSYSLVGGDLDGDGQPDIAATNLTGSKLSVFRNNFFVLNIRNPLPDSLCHGASFAIPFNVNRTLEPGNNFIAQLSNGSGTFSSPIEIGSLSATTSGEIQVSIPENIETGNNYRIRIITTSINDTSIENGSPINIFAEPNQNLTIAGKINVCPGSTEIYSPNIIQSGIRYNWKLSGGGQLDTAANKATILWQQTGTYQLELISYNYCDSVSKIINVQVLENNLSGSFTKLLPVDGAINISLPTTLSWVPITNAEHYDIYIWQSINTRPTLPTYSNATQINITVFEGVLLNYGAEYKWQVVAKTGCYHVESAIQKFRVRDLPDLIVENIQIPQSGFSGQQMSLKWRVKNTGLGGTLNKQWTDKVYLSLDANLILTEDVFLGSLSNFSTLPVNSSYEETASFKLPNGINNNYYVFVVTNQGEMRETDLTNNSAISTNNSFIQLTPPPDLQVTSVITVNNTFSGETINVNWKVKNLGTGSTQIGHWYDHIYISSNPVLDLSSARDLGIVTYKDGALEVGQEYSKSSTIKLPDDVFGTYYLFVLTDNTNLVYEHALDQNNEGRSQPINIILIPPIDLVITGISIPSTASTFEKITISYNIENQGGSSTKNKIWYDYLYISQSPVFDAGSAALIGSITHSTALNPGDVKNIQYNFYIPENYQGEYYIHVVTDKSNNIFEYTNENNNTSTSQSTLNIIPVDISVNDLVYPQSDTAGNSFLMQWTIKNDGPGKILNGYTSNIFLSPTPVFSSETAIKLFSKQAVTNALGVGFSVNHSEIVKIPEGLSGNYYLIVKATQFAFETNTINNEKVAPINIILGPWADLQVTDIQMSDSASIGNTIPVSYIVINRGMRTTRDSVWTDKIFIAPNTNPSSSTFIGSFTHNMRLEKDSSKIVNTIVNIPYRLLSGSYIIRIVTDVQNEIYENTDEGNNFLTKTIFLKPYPPIDLVATDFQTPESSASGKSIEVSYTVTNIGLAKTLNYGWADAYYYSEDNLFDSTDILIDDVDRFFQLDTAKSYTIKENITLPNGIAGDFYILAVADRDNEVNDINLLNNYSSSSIHIALTPPPDLEITNLKIPEEAPAGQPLQITWRVTNSGPGATIPSSWTDKFYLSKDLVLGNGDDLIIGSLVNTNSLASGQSYDTSLQVVLPIEAMGNYILFAKTDANNVVYEQSSENNNQVVATLTINRPLASDLIVSDIIAPDTVSLGEQVTIQWKVSNIGENLAAGIMYQGVFLSEDTNWDVNDILFGVVENSISISPQGELNAQMTNYIKDAGFKKYYIIVRTDIKNNIYELSDDNNINVSLVPTQVIMSELVINVVKNTSISNGVDQFYKILVPDSLIGESLQVTSKGSVANGQTEIYLRHADVPNRAVFDYASHEPNQADQETIIPELKSGEYYLMADGMVSGNSQTVELLAKVLKYAITSVNSDKGGNTGSVTVQVKGAKLSNLSKLYLHLGSIVIPADSFKIINSTLVYVSFNLKDRPQATYNVVAVNTVGDTAILQNGFTIVAGLSPTLYTNVAVPNDTRLGNIITIAVQFTNAGNTDIVNPELQLRSIAGAPISFSIAGLSANTTELMIPVSEINGPPGILRPGASGTVIVYAKATTTLSFTLIQPKKEF